MGMFDQLVCEFPLPDATAEIQRLTFQTKDFECAMDDYDITADGRLLPHEYELRALPNSEREVIGGLRWPSFERIEKGMTETPHHGDIRFYTNLDRPGGTHERMEYKARFTEGHVQWIKRVPSAPE